MSDHHETYPNASSDTPTHTATIDDIFKTETTAVSFLKTMAAQINNNTCKKYPTTSPLANGKMFTQSGKLPTICYTTSVKTDKESLRVFIVAGKREENDEQIQRKSHR